MTLSVIVGPQLVERRSVSATFWMERCFNGIEDTITLAAAAPATTFLMECCAARVVEEAAVTTLVITPTSTIC